MKWYEMGFYKIYKTKKGKCIGSYKDWRVTKIHKTAPKVMSLSEAKFKQRIVVYADNAKDARDFAREVCVLQWNYSWNKKWGGGVKKTPLNRSF